MKKTLFLTLLLTFAGLVISQVALAQPPPPPLNPTSVPIDGGLSILLAAGAGLGAKKAWDLRQK
ncbi:MAG: hypothetical protein C0424_06595 [Sphingobacteriaceae bacterium]|nr:hypothetical protein [Sphingobacteriaceae bacterium]